jgi:hypothetical protein
MDTSDMQLFLAPIQTLSDKQKLLSIYSDTDVEL